MRFFKPTLSTFLTFAALHVSAAARAEIAVLEPIKDGTLYEDIAGGRANGAGNHFFVGQTGQLVVVRGLLEFDVAGSVPVGATVLSASLSLHMSRTLNNQEIHSVSLHRVTEEWGEAGSVAGQGEGGGTAAQEGDATWRYTFFSTDSWASLGGDFDAVAIASTDVSSVGFYSWTSPELLAEVQLFHEEPSQNHGWILIGNELLPRAKRFDTRENPDVGTRPQLIIEFEPLWLPSLAPAGFALLVVAMAAAAAASLRR
jgi:hypothetical protein